MRLLPEVSLTRDSAVEAVACDTNELRQTLLGERRICDVRQLRKKVTCKLEPTPARLCDGGVCAGADDAAPIAEVQAR